MKRLVVKQHRAFTLVEIMVTMAILVVMMSFMFQFVIGAQRIWSASTKDMEVYEQAQIIFNVMETDLKNMICEIPDDNPDGGMQVYLERDGSRLEKMCFMTSYSSEGAEANGTNDKNLTTRVGVYPVFYSLDPIAGSSLYRLYRYNFDRIPSGTSRKPFFAYGARHNITGTNSFETNLNSFKTSVLTSGSERDQMYDLISEEIENLTVEVFPSTIDNNLLTGDKPISFRLTVELRQKELNAAKPPVKRRFTKIIFID